MITTSNTPAPVLSADRSNNPESSELQLPPRVERGLLTLLEARDYARDLQTSVWDFAVEIDSLREMQLTKSDLRWMIGRGLMEHAVEVTLIGDAERSFRQPMRPLFCKRACFVLTASGVAMARSLRGETEAPAGLVLHSRTTASWAPAIKNEPLVPKWDRDRQELRVGNVLVKQFKVPAVNQEAILAAFEEESWPPRIDDPLPPHHEQSPKRRLQETIKSLNRNQKRCLLRFLGDGSGQGVRWEFADSTTAAEE